jgi:hypothetical protein
MSVTSERVVYLGDRRSLQIEWPDLLELRVKPHSVVLAAPHGITEVLVPLLRAVGSEPS